MGIPTSYENLDVRTINPAPDEVAEVTKKERDNYLKEFIKSQIEKETLKLPEKANEEEIEKESYIRFNWYKYINKIWIRFKYYRF